VVTPVSRDLPRCWLLGNMAIKRDRRKADNSDSDDITGDDSVSGDDDWTSSGDGASSTSVKMARTDVAVDYSIGSSAQSSSTASTATRPANTPRRHTGPRKPRVNEKVRYVSVSNFCLL